MIGTNTTKRQFARALKELLKEQPLPKISVGEICEKCKMNRKSFYYHFKDKEDLINWIFDTEFVEHIENDANVSIWTYINALVEYLYSNKSFYKKALKYEGQNSFSEHLYDWCHLLLTQNLSQALEIPYISEVQIGFFADGLTCTIKRWIASANEPTEEVMAQIKACISII